MAQPDQPTLNQSPQIRDHNPSDKSSDEPTKPSTESASIDNEPSLGSDYGSTQPALNINEIWKIASEQIKLKVSPQNYQAWFKNTSLLEIEKGIATVSCPSSYSRDWLESNHQKLLTNIMREVTKQDIEVVFMVGCPPVQQDGSQVDLRADTVRPNTAQPPSQPQPTTQTLQPTSQAAEPATDQVATQATSPTNPASNPPSNSPVQNDPAPPSQVDRYQNLAISPEEAPIFNVQYTHQSHFEESQSKASLNPNYLFDSFVVGASNRLAHAAAEAVAENPGHAYNPFFIWGGVGLGKTHLSQAIGNRILNNDPNRKVLYVPSETFLNELVEAIRKDENSEFREKYRKLDVLIIDDIQFISGRETTQEELFHTFNTLYQAGKQIIFASDRPPKMIDNLEDRLRSRFEGGMVADINQPNLELRMAIVKQKAEDRGILLPDNILMFVAQTIDNNIRELEGALVKIGTHVKYDGIIPDESQVAQILEVDAESKRKKTSPREIVQGVCKEFNVSVRDVRGKRRTAEFVVPRQVCMYLLRSELELPLEQVAKELNRRDHTTVLHAVERVEEKMEEDEEFKEKVQECRV